MSPEQILEFMQMVYAWVNKPSVVLTYNLVFFICSLILIGISAKKDEVFSKNLLTLVDVECELWNVSDALFVGRGMLVFSVPRLINIAFLSSLQILRDIVTNRAAVTGVRSQGPGVEPGSGPESGPEFEPESGPVSGPESGQRIGPELEPGSEKMVAETEDDSQVESPDTRIKVDSDWK